MMDALGWPVFLSSVLTRPFNLSSLALSNQHLMFIIIIIGASAEKDRRERHAVAQGLSPSTLIAFFLLLPIAAEVTKIHTCKISLVGARHSYCASASLLCHQIR